MCHDKLHHQAKPLVYHPFLLALFVTYLFHVAGEKSRSIGMISNLPANISNIITNFDKTEKSPKLPMGPTFPSPGPILLSVAATAVTLLVKSKLSKEMSKVDMANIKILEIKNTLMEYSFVSLFFTI